MSIQHLQTEQPTMRWDLWYKELVQLYAAAEQIEPIAASRHVNIVEARKWYRDGFTPYVTFRETYNQ